MRGETAIGKISRGMGYSWKLVWRANGGVLFVYFLADTVQALCPLAQVYILNLLIDAVIGRNRNRSLVLAAVWIAAILLGNLALNGVYAHLFQLQADRYL